MLGICSVAYSRKETGTGNFSLRDVDILRKKMRLTDEELKQIFFAG